MNSPSRVNLLFVCSKNQWRSPTAEKIYSRDDRFDVRSRGTARSARRVLAKADIAWAEIILVMEHKHRQRIRADFPDLIQHKNIQVMDIPDEYQYLDPQLVDLVTTFVESFMEDFPPTGGI